MIKIVGKMAKDTFGIVSRVCEIELPYIDSFVLYHQRIGISQFVFISYRSSETPIIKQYLRKYSTVNVINVDHSRKMIKNSGFKKGQKVKHYSSRLMGCQNQALEKLNTTWVLGLDLDEYFTLPKPFKKISQWQKKISTRKNEWYSLPWRMVVNDKISVSQKMKSFKGHAGKYMVRKDCVMRLREHTPDTRGCKRKNSNGAHLTHYWGRSLNDIILKCVFHEFNSKKKSSIKAVKGIINGGNLPIRMRLLAFLSSSLNKRPKHNLVCEQQLKINKLKEVELIKRILTSKEHNNIKEIYFSYKENLCKKGVTNKKGTKLLKYRGDLRKLSNRLPKK
jgi:hypothetical protein